MLRQGFSFILSLIILGLCLGIKSRGAAHAQAQPAEDKSVRFVYLVSKDRKLEQRYLDAISNAARDVRQWYKNRTGGYSFRLNSPIVEVAYSEQASSWFYQNRNGDNQEDWGFNNTLAEATRLLGAKQNDPNYIWVIYSDGPGNKGRGGQGVACLPEDDLLGLIGRHPTQKDIPRWVGGLAHELGHALGLDHPQDTSKDEDAVMWIGFYGKYPKKAYLTASDKLILAASPFFFDAQNKPAFAGLKPLERFVYGEGAFERFAAAGAELWRESKIGSSDVFLFREIRRDSGIVLSDEGRGFLVHLPLGDGNAFLSEDSGLSWSFLYAVKRAY